MLLEAKNQRQRRPQVGVGHVVEREIDPFDLVAGADGHLGDDDGIFPQPGFVDRFQPDPAAGLDIAPHHGEVDLRPSRKAHDDLELAAKGTAEGGGGRYTCSRTGRSRRYAHRACPATPAGL